MPTTHRHWSSTILWAERRYEGGLRRRNAVKCGLPSTAGRKSLFRKFANFTMGRCLHGMVRVCLPCPTAPEPPDSGEECFFPAPDGRGMWFVGQSGNVYRLDDHTGKLIERVKLPFSVINLVREP